MKTQNLLLIVASACVMVLLSSGSAYAQENQIIAEYLAKHDENSTDTLGELRHIAGDLRQCFDRREFRGDYNRALRDARWARVARQSERACAQRDPWISKTASSRPADSFGRDSNRPPTVCSVVICLVSWDPFFLERD